MQRTLAVFLLVGCIFAAADSFAQTQSTRSHRAIPRSTNQKAPSRDDFKTPQLKEMEELFRSFMREQRNSARRKRDAVDLPGEPVTPTPDDISDNADRPFDDREGRQFEDVSNNISRMHEEMAQRLGGDLGNTMQPDAIPFDANKTSDLWTRVKDLQEEYSRQQAVARDMYREAMKKFEEWPSDSIPPAEWIQKVQPLLNQEFADQMREVIKANRNREQSKDGSPLLSNGSTKPGETGTSSSPLSSDSAWTPSENKKSMVESLISAIDKKGTQLLKESSRDPDKNSRIKKVAGKASDWLKKLNSGITANSQRIASRRSESRSTSTSPFSMNGPGNLGPPPSIDSRTGTTVIGGVALAALLGYGLWFFRDRFALAVGPPAAARIDAGMIHDQQSLLEACHRLSQRCFGWPSRFWNHRKVFARLAREFGGDQSNAVTGLADIYEHARYAPSGLLSQHQVTTARRLFAEIEDLPAAV